MQVFSSQERRLSPGDAGAPRLATFRYERYDDIRNGRKEPQTETAEAASFRRRGLTPARHYLEQVRLLPEHCGRLHRAIVPRVRDGCRDLAAA
jgi:hypothetical protein